MALTLGGSPAAALLPATRAAAQEAAPPAAVTGEAEVTPQVPVQVPAQVIQAVLIDYRIELSTHGVTAGPVRFEVANAGQTRHTLRVEGYGLDTRTTVLYIGDTATLDVTFAVPGEYSVYCDVGFHAGAGMVTALELTGG